MWQQMRENEINQRLEAIQNREDMEGNDDPQFIEQQRESLLNEEDWRGYKMC
jgi:hypothetical protein